MPTLSDRQRRLLPLLTIPVVLVLIGSPWLLLYRAENRTFLLKVSTGQPGGVYHPLAEAITDVVTRDNPRLTFELLPSDGSVMSMRRIDAGECQLALLQNGTPGSDKVRALMPLYAEILHVLVPADSTAKELRDLRGKRLAVGPKESGTQQVVQPLLRHFGLDDGAFDPVYTDMADACSKLLADEIDAVFIVAGIHAPAIRDLMARGKARLIGIGNANETGGEVEGFRLHYPDVEPSLIPIGTFPSHDPEQQGRPRQAVQTVAVPSLLVCSADVDETVVNKITRAIFENRTSLIRRHAAASQIGEPDSATSLSYPLHSGADAYYRREEPSFLVSHAEVMAFLMSVAFSIWGASLAVRNWLRLRKKDRIDDYYVRIDAILSKLHGEQPVGKSDLHAMERELSRLRQKAVHQLVAEQLTANESFRIFQTLLANSQAEVRRQLDKSA